jgi:uncharacterized Zn-finger protein
MSRSGYPKFRNDRGVPEIRIGVREFKCIGVSPPLDHPHVYINMGEADTILCPYCATRFRFDPRLTPLAADPPDSYFADHDWLGKAPTALGETLRAGFSRGLKCWRPSGLSVRSRRPI